MMSPLDELAHAIRNRCAIPFVGYSMSDMNIRLLLHRLWQTWSRSGYEKDRPRSFVFMPHADPAQEAVLSRWGITSPSGQEDSPEEALCAFLSDLENRVGAC